LQGRHANVLLDGRNALAVLLSNLSLRQQMPKPLRSADYSLFIEELRAARDRAGLSQQELATLIGEDQSYVSKCERGIRRVDVVELKRWTDALGIGLIEFVKLLDQRRARHQVLNPIRRHKS